jgi:hypothetical protein
MMSLLKHLLRALGWLMVILAVTATTWALGAERWSDHWGATDQEVAIALPGDDLIEEPSLVTTRAVTIRVPAKQVWPWIAQFGQGRGGLYSYDWLEQVFGIDMTSAGTILAGEQDIAAGDQIWVTQPGYPADLGLVVADLQPGRALVLAASTPSRPARPEDAPWTWSFVLQPQDDGTTRLIVRNRNATIGAAGDAIWDRIVGPISFAMERKTMSGIAQRAEAAAGLDVGWASREAVWFAGLVVTGVAVLVIAATRTPSGRKAAYIMGFTAAATLVLFRYPSAVVSVVLAALGILIATVVWQAWPPLSRPGVSQSDHRAPLPAGA